MDVTNRQSGPVNTEATIRVGAPQAAQAGASDVTVRPGAQMQDHSDDDFRDGDFILKGRMYRGIKCLSDNSGEAQVFLVEGDEGERVLPQLHHQEWLDAHHPEFQSGDDRQDYRLRQDLCGG